MIFTAQRFGSAAAVAIVLGLLSLLSGSGARESVGVLAQSQPDCTVTLQPGQSIQSAIDAAQAGAVICLAAGTWEENIYISKNLTLRGAGREKTNLVPEGNSIIIPPTPNGAVFLEKLTVTGGRFLNISISAAKVMILDSQISKSGETGVHILGPADVTIVNSQLLDNKGYAIYMQESSQLMFVNSEISDNGGGILMLNVWGFSGRPVKATILDSQVSSNRAGGIVLGGVIGAEAYAEIKNSLIQGNGTSEECKKKNFFCHGIAVHWQSRVKLTSSKILDNADWGIWASLQRCGYSHDLFGGSVAFESMGLSDIKGNNKTGNNNGLGNPGNHPWNRPGVPDGQVCLP